MSRDLTTDVVTAVEAAEVFPQFLVHLDLSGGQVYVWSGAGNYDYDGNTYTGVGQFGGISPVEEGQTIDARGVRLSLSGIPSDAVALVLSEPYRGRPITIRLALFDGPQSNGGTLIDDPVIIFRGLIDTASLDDTPESPVITITAESRLIDLERPRELRYTDAEQQRLYPGDLGLQYVAGLSDKEIAWGVPVPAGQVARVPFGGATFSIPLPNA